LKLDEKEMMEVITRAAASSVLENLKKKGVINSVEDEDGEEHFFLTEEGKKIAESIQKNYNETQKDSE
jgi:DNA-binding MarR family transcriptional regulator